MAKAAPAKQSVQPTFYISDDASMDEFLTAVGLDRPERGSLPMIQAMRLAAEKGFAFTVNGYRPSEGVVASTKYTIKHKSPAGVGELVLDLDAIRELNGVDKGTRGRTSIQAFTNAVAAKIGQDVDFVKCLSIIGDAPGARDLMVPLERKGKGKASANSDSTENTDETGEDNGDNNSDDAPTDSE